MVYGYWKKQSLCKKILQTISGEYFKNYEIKEVHRNKNNVRLYYGSIK